MKGVTVVNLIDATTRKENVVYSRSLSEADRARLAELARLRTLRQLMEQVHDRKR